MGKVNLTANNDTEQLVITPGGLRPKSKVHLIENGFHVNLKHGILSKINSSNNELVKKFGKINSVKPEYLNNRNSIRKLFREKEEKFGEFPSPITDRWIIYGGWKNDSNNPISYFSTKWVVPPPPITSNGQLIYLFNGIETTSFDSILQPVLQWGSSHAGGGSYWAVANWFVGSPGTGIALHSNLIPVNSGDIIQGILILENKSGNKFSYISSFMGMPECDLHISNIDELTWANETLECYGLKFFSDYPNAIVTQMEEIEIRNGAAQAQIIWEANNDVTDNGQHCKIVSNASPNSIVELYYKQQLT